MPVVSSARPPAREAASGSESAGLLRPQAGGGSSQGLAGAGSLSKATCCGMSVVSVASVWASPLRPSPGSHRGAGPTAGRPPSSPAQTLFWQEKCRLRALGGGGGRGGWAFSGEGDGGFKSAFRSTPACALVPSD